MLSVLIVPPRVKLVAPRIFTQRDGKSRRAGPKLRPRNGKPRGLPVGQRTDCASGRRQGVRPKLWLVPSLEILAAIALYAGTHVLDKAAYDGSLTLPSWMVFGSA